VALDEFASPAPCKCKFAAADDSCDGSATLGAHAALGGADAQRAPPGIGISCAPCTGHVRARRNGVKPSSNAREPHRAATTLAMAQPALALAARRASDPLPTDSQSLHGLPTTVDVDPDIVVDPPMGVPAFACSKF
jgi:hypothetical protein